MQRHLTPELRAPRWMNVLLWTAASVSTVFVIPALFMEVVKLIK